MHSLVEERSLRRQRLKDDLFFLIVVFFCFHLTPFLHDFQSFSYFKGILCSIYLYVSGSPCEILPFKKNSFRFAVNFCDY